MKSTSGRSAKLVPTEATFSVNYTLSPHSQLHKTGKVTQTSMFRTNKTALIFMRFEQSPIFVGPQRMGFDLLNPIY